MERRKRAIRFLVAAAAGMALLLGSAGAAAAAPATPAPLAGATLTGASITFNTFNDDKDNDTFVRVTVNGDNGLAAVTSGFFGLFPDQSTKGPFNMTVRSGVRWESLTDNHVIITITPNGNDTWKFGFQVNLFFSDGSVEPEFLDFTTLSQSSRTGDYEFVF
ncbi:hypothetical protein [Paractinoplanes atraurantiacus]|uniref:Uncharacterized protein n=1 Tax=Paractinoplanes atraurantiacus TaxID=1036182 RepID=A0A285JLF1_9ACTN|nr:hypothetical protein [Actinoplanes atraurantiacus]SNY60176.1 hypothetical protein SAMN05421748_12166 [Actinoplanes atraurantiacus]